MATTSHNLSDWDSERLSLFVGLILDHASHIRPDKPTLYPPLIKIPRYKLERDKFDIQEIKDLVVLINKIVGNKVIGNFVEETISEHMDQKNEEEWFENNPFDDITQRYNEIKRKEIIQKFWFQFRLCGTKFPEELDKYLILNLYEKRNLNELIKLNKQTGPKKIQETTAKQVKKYLISKDNSGHYFYKSKPIIFENTDTEYFRVFDALFDEQGQDGYLSYKNINKGMEKRGSQKLRDDKEIRVRILNAVGRLFKYPKCGGESLKNLAPDRRKIVSPRRGRGLTFYNPQV